MDPHIYNYKEDPDYQFAAHQTALGHGNEKVILDKNRNTATNTTIFTTVKRGQIKSFLTSCVDGNETARISFQKKLTDLYGAEIAKAAKKDLPKTLTPNCIKTAFEQADAISRQGNPSERTEKSDTYPDLEEQPGISSRDKGSTSSRYLLDPHSGSYLFNSPYSSMMQAHRRTGSEYPESLQYVSNAPVPEGKKASFLIYLNDHNDAWTKLCALSPKLQQKLSDPSFHQKWTRYFSKDPADPLAIDDSPTRQRAREKVLLRIKDEITASNTESLDDIIADAVEDQLWNLHEKDLFLIRSVPDFPLKVPLSERLNALETIRETCREGLDKNALKKMDGCLDMDGAKEIRANLDDKYTINTLDMEKRLNSLLEPLNMSSRISEKTFKDGKNYQSKYVAITDTMTRFHGEES